MAITRTQTASGNNATGALTVSATWLAATTNHSCLVAIVCSRGNPSITKPINTFWISCKRQISANLVTEIFVWNDAGVMSGAVTFALGSSQKATIHIVEYANAYFYNMPNGVTMDGNTSATGTSANPGASTSGNTTNADDLMVTGLNSVGAGTYSAPTNGFSLVNTDASTGGSAATRNSSAFLEKIATATGTYFAQATLSASAEWVSVHITLFPNPTNVARQWKNYSRIPPITGPQTITGIGFQPDVIVQFQNNATAQVAGIRINSGNQLDANVWGFFMGLDANSGIDNVVDQVNSDGWVTSTGEIGVTYHWFAFKRGTSDAGFDYGMYMGDGTDNRNIALPFQPDLVAVFDGTKGVGGAYNGYRTSDFSGDDSGAWQGVISRVDYIQGFGVTSFQVGTIFNAVGVPYLWIAFKKTVGVNEGNFQNGTYIGDGTDDRNIAVLTGFQPTMTFLQNRSSAFPGNARFETEPDDRFLYFAWGNAENSNGIQRNHANGFQVGTADNVNVNNYTYCCWIGGLIGVIIVPERMKMGVGI